jgi:CRISPR-associated protein Cas1
MEEFRSILADRVALSLINLNQITGKGFTTTESGAVMMDSATRKTVLQTWQKKKQETIQHPFLDEKVEVGLLPYAQALLLSRHLRGDLDAYPPFLLK